MRVAINGFGRIGRLTFRELLNKKDLEVVAINDLTDTETLAHLLQYDSTQGKLAASVSSTENELTVDGKAIRIFSEKNPENLPWKDLKIDLVIECTGIFRSQEKLNLHLKAGARKVLLSAPGTDVKTVVLGVNQETLTKDDQMISNASCTTNCLAPMASILQNEFGIVKGFMTTTHAYTADQNLQDAPHKDLRRARAAAINIIPTSTGAAQAVGLVIPELDGKLDGFALRVPTPAGSITDLTVELTSKVSPEKVNEVIKAASEKHLQGILEYSTAPLVSSDIVGNRHSCIFDSSLTLSIDNMIKVVGWYDNESGYAARLADLADFMMKL